VEPTQTILQNIICLFENISILPFLLTICIFGSYYR